MNFYRWIWLFLFLQSAVVSAEDTKKTVAKKDKNEPVVLTSEVNTILQQKMTKYLETQEDRAKRVLGLQLADGRFILYIKSSISQEKINELLNTKFQETKLTTLPMSMSAQEKLKVMAERLTVDQVPLFIGPLTVFLTFGNDVSESQISSLKEATANGLGLDLKGGDSFVVKKSDLIPQSSNKDVDKLRHDSVIAQQKISQSESENLKLQSTFQQLKNELATAQEKVVKADQEKSELDAKIRSLEEDLSIYKTPMGDIKKIVKGLELPLTVLPIALVFFIFSSLLFFLYLRLQTTKATKFLEVADVLAQGMIRAGKAGANNSPKQNSQKSEMDKVQQASESSVAGSGTSGPILLGDEIVALKMEALEAWSDLSQYPFLTTSELREWLVAGGSQLQKFISVMVALGPVESVKLLRKFSPTDLTQIRKLENSQDSASKLPGYAAILQLHRFISTQILNLPEAIIRLDFPELVKASDEALTESLAGVDSKSMALCLYILPENRRLGIIEAFSAKLQRDAVEGFASLDGTTPERIDLELSSLKTQLVPSLLKSSVIRFAIAEDITQLLDEVSPKTRASLQEALSLHKDLDDQINASLITFDDVLAVDDDTLGELLDEFSPEQTAILMSGVSQEHSRRIAKILPRKIAVTVESELSRISSRQSSLKRAQNQSLEYQSLLRERLKDLVAEGVIELDKGNSSKSKESDSSSDQEQERSPGFRESA